MKQTMTILKKVGLFGIIMLLAVACGSDAPGANGNTSAGADDPATATSFPTFEFVAPTNPPVFSQNADETEEAGTEEVPELDPVMVERGQGRYEALDCASCHGENGEGTDDGSALIGFSQSEDDFVAFMRSGGEIGSDHQFSTDRLSERGVQNLYQYLLSLSE